MCYVRYRYLPIDTLILHSHCIIDSSTFWFHIFFPFFLALLRYPPILSCSLKGTVRQGFLPPFFLYVHCTHPYNAYFYPIWLYQWPEQRKTRTYFSWINCPAENFARNNGSTHTIPPPTILPVPRSEETISETGEALVRLYFVQDTFITVPTRVFQPDVVSLLED